MPRKLKRRSDAISRDRHDDNDINGDESATEVGNGSSGSEVEVSAGQRQRQTQRQNQKQKQQHSSRKTRRSPSLDDISDDNDDDEEEYREGEGGIRKRNKNKNKNNKDNENGYLDADADADTDLTGDGNGRTVQTLSKKLVRLALSSEYGRVPLRRTDIAQKIFKEANASHRLFKSVFAAAQGQLQTVFGMQLVELPSREKTTLKDRRAQAAAVGPSQTNRNTQRSQQGNTLSTSKGAAAGGIGGNNSSSNRAWILESTLPTAYKTHPAILSSSVGLNDRSSSTFSSSQPHSHPSSHARSHHIESEGEYAALYTFILSLIYLNPAQMLSEAKLERYLKRVNADVYTPFGTLDKLLKRMEREGYIERRRETSTGEENVEFVVGPRGKVEVGVQGVAGLVRTVYGYGAVSLDGSVDGNRTGAVEAGEDRGGGDGNDTNNPTHTRLVKIERDELERKLARSLGDTVVMHEKAPVPHPAAAVVGRNDGDPMDVDADADADADADEDIHEARAGTDTRQRRVHSRENERRQARGRRGEGDDEDDDNDDSE